MNNAHAPAEAPKAIPTSKTRTWRIQVPVCYESGCAPVRWDEYEVTLTADAKGTLTAEVDGLPTSLRRAINLLTEAKDEGKLTLLHEAYTDTLDKANAHALHVDLGKIGLKNWQHYSLAASIVGREITSLTQVRHGEVAAILGAALRFRGMTGM